jgi:hypothetical protein
MIEARTPEANNCKASCLFYTEKLSGGAERTANYVLWNQLAAGAIEGDRKYQTIWVYPPKSNATSVDPLMLYRAYMIRNTIHRTGGMESRRRNFLMTLPKPNVPTKTERKMMRGKSSSAVKDDISCPCRRLWRRSAKEWFI